MTSVNQEQFLLPPSPPLQEEEKELNLIPGNFEYIKDKTTREMLKSAWQAITITENWNFIMQDIESFTFSCNPIVSIIMDKIVELGYLGHSGCSFGYTMRVMQFISKYGEQKYKEDYETYYNSKKNN